MKNIYPLSLKKIVFFSLITISLNAQIYTPSRTIQGSSGNTNVGIGTISPGEKLEVVGNVKAQAFIKTGGTSSQFLKANGTIDSNTYALDNAVVKLTGDQTISGLKTFSNSIMLNGSLNIVSGGYSLLFNPTNSAYWQTYVDASNIFNFGYNGTNVKAKINSSGGIIANSFIKLGGTSSQYLMADGSVSTLNNPITGTTNYLSKFTGSSALGNSLIYDNGTNLGIGTTSPREKLEVVGNAQAQAFIKTGGTSSQFLKANGTIDSNTYALDNAVVHLTGTETIIGQKTFTNTVNASTFKKINGLSTEFLMADGSVSTGPAVGSYVDLTTNQTISGEKTFTSPVNITGNLLTFGNSGVGRISHENNTLKFHNIGYGDYQFLNATGGTIFSISNLGTNTFSNSVEALSFKKKDGLSTEFLMADGSVSTGPAVGSYVDLTNNQTITGEKTFTNTVNASIFKKIGGSNTQFLKADGSVDSKTYIDDSNNQTIGGFKTFSNNLTGTRAQFSQSSFFDTFYAHNGNLGGTGIRGGAHNGIAAYFSNNSTTYPVVKLFGLSNTVLLEGRDNADAIKFTLTSQGNVTANSFIKSGGLSTEYLMADGSVSTSVSVAPLEFNLTDKTVWNNGKGNVESNTSFGEGALRSNTTGYENTANGYSALWNNTTGNNNTALGFRAGQSDASFNPNSITNNSIYIGSETKANASDETNQIVIGHEAVGAGSNSVTLGNSDITKTILRGDVSGAKFIKSGGLPTQYLMADGSVSTLTNPITGTTNYLSKFTGTSALGNSLIYDNGTNLGIGTTSPIQKLTVNGNVLATSFKKENGLSSQYLMADGSVSTAVNVEPLEFNLTDKTVWNNGKGDIVSNTSFGKDALLSNTTGSYNTVYGFNGLRFNTTGSGNTAIGSSSLESNSSGGYNTAVGGSVLQFNTSGDNNTAIGYYSLSANSTGSNNTGVGQYSLALNSTGQGNTAIGKETLRLNSTGSNNTSNGFGALYQNTTGNRNTSLGAEALYGNTSGADNVAIGYQAGKFFNFPSTNSTGNNSIFIGSSTSPLNNNQTNQIVIGYNATGAGSNTTTIGNTSITKTVLRGDVVGDKFIKSGGLSTQYLMADGSVSTGASSGSYVDLTTDQTIAGDKTFTSTVNASTFKKTGGLSTEYLMADGSVSTGASSGSYVDLTTDQTIAGDKTFTNTVNASTFKKTGGLSTEYLMADGSVSTAGAVDFNTFHTGTLTSGFIPKATGASTLGNSLIYDNGTNVGIGTINPDAKLAVKGLIHTQEVKVDLQGAVAPDYVFASDYKLKSLEEVEKYIQENKHLPEIPSALTMEKEGVLLKEMNLNLLKKIEELTLYAIAQQKEIKGLKKENQNYKSLSERLNAVEKELKK